MIPRPIRFAKLNSAGNDFICIDNTQGRLDALLTCRNCGQAIRALCRRGLSIGADGAILACQLGSGPGVDIVARFLEPDGSEANLCGNGTACFTYWAVTEGLVAGPEVQILTKAGTAQGRIDQEDPRRVRVCVPDPNDLTTDLTVDTRGQKWMLDYVDTGVPHAIAYVSDLNSVDVGRWGRLIRHHPRFAPRGANANFVEILDIGRIAVRTFEFGVEAETLACGTGSAAAAILTALREDWPAGYRTGSQPVTVVTRSGDELLVWFTCRDGVSVTDVCLETRVRPVYKGELYDAFVDELVAEVTDPTPQTAESPSPHAA